MPGPVVFISYSHDSAEHRERVLGLAARLRQDGLETRLDQEVNGTPEQGWPRWMLDQLDEAAFILVVCTETYYRRFRGHEEPGCGRGADWEGALITQEIYDRKSRTTKFVPVMLSRGQDSYIPEPLRAHTHYELTSDERYQALYAFLLGQAGVDLGPLGTIKPVSRQAALPLAFGSPSAPRPVMIGVPHRNPFFTGREHLLSRLHQQLQTHRIPALAQAAIYGLGGIGKTQMAIEYAHRFGQHYRFVLWVVAEEETAIRAAYLSIARELKLVEAQDDLEMAVLAVKAWLSREGRWLLVFDNADNPALVRPYLPPVRTGGTVLLTSRARSFATVGTTEPFRVETLDPEDAVKFLIERSGQTDAGGAAVVLAGELGYLPLALEQAAAYIETVGISFADYLARYRRQGLTLLERGEPSADYSGTVATTWSLSLNAVREASLASAELLTAAAFLAPDSIPIEIFTRGGAELGKPPQNQKNLWRTILIRVSFYRDRLLGIGNALSKALAAADNAEFAVLELIKNLERYSLVERMPNNVFRLHRLVQEVIKASLSEQRRQAWAAKVVRVLNAAYPAVTFGTWQLCDILQPSARVASELARTHNLESSEAGLLFRKAGYFASERGDLVGAKLFKELSLGILERVLGSEHPTTLSARNNLAATLNSMGNPAGARKFFEQNLEIQERVLGSWWPDTIRSRHNLAIALDALGDTVGARNLYEQNLEPLKNWQRAKHHVHLQKLESTDTLASHLLALGDPVGAVRLLEHNLEIQERVMGHEHPETLKSRFSLAEALASVGDLAGAKKLYEYTLQIQERVLGLEHPDTSVSTWRLLATVLLLNDLDTAGMLIAKLLWLIARDEVSLSSADQRRIRKHLLEFLGRLNPS